jgi:hypothetical protein
MKKRPLNVATLTFYIMKIVILNLYIMKVKWARSIP